MWHCLIALILLPLEVFGLPFDFQCPEGRKALSRSVDDGTELHCVIRLPNGQDGEIDGPFLVYSERNVRLREGSMKDGKVHGLFREYDPDSGKLDTEAEMKDGQLDGRYTRFHPNGKRRGTGIMSKNQAVGNWSMWDESGKVLADNLPYAKVKEISAEYDSQKAKKQPKTTATANATTTDLKKNWEVKKAGSISSYFNKQAKLHLSSWLGMSSWWSAVSKCRNLGGGWHLPTDTELVTLVENGAGQVVPDFNNIFWTSVDQSKETDPQRSMVLGERSAWAVTGADGQLVPSEKKDELAVICVKK
jgi:hypothetical protein